MTTTKTRTMTTTTGAQRWREKLINPFIKAAAEDHTDADCLIVVVMSHGESGLLHSTDSLYPVDMLWAPFTGDRCSSLAGKPKLFFIQVRQIRDRYRQRLCTSLRRNRANLAPLQRRFAFRRSDGRTHRLLRSRSRYGRTKRLNSRRYRVE